VVNAGLTPATADPCHSRGPKRAELLDGSANRIAVLAADGDGAHGFASVVNAGNDNSNRQLGSALIEEKDYPSYQQGITGEALPDGDRAKMSVFYSDPACLSSADWSSDRIPA